MDNQPPLPPPPPNPPNTPNNLKNPTHPEVLTTYIKSTITQANSTLTDVTLHINNKSKYRAHRIVLSHYSKFFRSLFSSLSNVTTQFDVYLEGFEEEVVESVLGFMYTGVLVGGSGSGGDGALEEIGRLVDVASVLQIPDILNLIKYKDDDAQRTENNNKVWGKDGGVVCNNKIESYSEEYDEDDEEEHGTRGIGFNKHEEASLDGMEELLEDEDEEYGSGGGSSTTRLSLSGRFVEGAGEEEEDEDEFEGVRVLRGNKRRKQAKPKRHTSPTPSPPPSCDDEEEEDDNYDEVLNEKHPPIHLTENKQTTPPTKPDRNNEEIDDDDDEYYYDNDEDNLTNENNKSEQSKSSIQHTLPAAASPQPPPTHSPDHHLMYLRNIINSNDAMRPSQQQIQPPPFYHHHPGLQTHNKRIQKNLWGKLMVGNNKQGGLGHHAGSSRAQHSAPRGGPPRAWSNQDLTEALHNVWNKKMTTSQASRIFGIPYNSLLMYVRGKYGKSLKLDLLKKGLDLALLEKQKLKKSEDTTASTTAQRSSSNPVTTPSSSSPNNPGSSNLITPNASPLRPSLQLGMMSTPPALSHHHHSVSKHFHNNNVVEWMMMNGGKILGGGGGGSSGAFNPHHLFFGGGNNVGK